MQLAGSDAPGSELSINDILERVVHQCQIGVHALELGVLVLQLAKLRQVRHRHARELAFPLVVRRLADAVLSTRLTDLGTGRAGRSSCSS